MGPAAPLSVCIFECFNVDDISIFGAVPHLITKRFAREVLTKLRSKAPSASLELVNCTRGVNKVDAGKSAENSNIDGISLI